MSTADDREWFIENTRADAAALDQFAAVCNISNGYLGLCGRIGERRTGRSPMTIINGVYDEIDQFGTLGPYRPDQRYLDPEQMKHPRKSPAIANLPNPLALRVFLDDEELIFENGTTTNFLQRLDLRRGLYSYEYDFQDAHSRTTRIEMRRFASLGQAHRVHLRYRVTPLNHAARLTIQAGIDAATHSNTTRERQYIVREKGNPVSGQVRLRAATPARKHDVFIAACHRFVDAAPEVAPEILDEEHGIYTCSVFQGAPGRSVTMETVIVVASSEDARHRVTVDLEKECEAAAGRDFEVALNEQTAAWAELWERADVRIEGDAQARLYLRFCVYHLLAAAPRFTDRLSVPVKLLSGEYYQGNTFYDTELYIVPFYAFVAPEYARTCLRYRYHGLVAGRAIARDLGRHGAKFAWQSGPYGEECLGPWYRFVHTNIHIDADVAYSLMLYFSATGDSAFLHEYGLDILVESARFYHSRTSAAHEGGCLSLRDVAGPDEGHCESIDNFYTNYLAQKTLSWAAEQIERLAQTEPEEYQRVAARLRLERDEHEKWKETAVRLRILRDPETELIEQCEDFFRLPFPPVDLLEGRKEWFTTVYPYQALNQPDVLLAFSLFPDDFDEATWRRNYDYYYKLSMNFSSMSFAVNSLTSLRLNQVEEAYSQFMIAAGMDLDESLTGRRDTQQGLHGTAMAGAWQAAIFGFAGVRVVENELRIDPRLPAAWKSISFRLVLRGVRVAIRITRDRVRLVPLDGRSPALSMRVAGRQIAWPDGNEIEVVYVHAPGSR